MTIDHKLKNIFFHGKNVLAKFNVYWPLPLASFLEAASVGSGTALIVKK